MFTKNWNCLLAVVFVVAIALPVQATTITWDAPQTITGNSDVSFEGTLVRAVGCASTATITVGGNSVLFEDTLTAESHSFVNSYSYTCDGTLSSSAGDSISTSPLPPATGTDSWGVGRHPNTYGPVNGLSAAWKTILESGIETDIRNLDHATMTLGGLTPNHSYLLQLWVNDSRGSYGPRSEYFDGQTDKTIPYDTGNGVLNKYIIGRFTATGSTQSFTINGSPSFMVNAYQLRDVIPEPSTTVLLGMGLLGLLARRRLRA